MSANKHPKRRKKTNKKTKLLSIIAAILFLISIVLLVIYFADIKKEVDNKKTNSETTITKKLEVFDEDSNKRPIAVMLDTNIGNQSHAGLQDSYLNYEIIVEGGLTRIMAIFKDKDVSLIGPVRSSRHYFLDYALESDCIYTHYGWSTYAENDIKNLNVDNINGLYDDEVFWRDKTIAAPHNVFTSIERNYSYATKKDYKQTSNNWKLLKYSTDEIELNTPISVKKQKNPETGKVETVENTNPELLNATSVILPYSYYQTRSYTYDQNRGVYLRYMNNEPHVDKTTKQQLYYKNIIIEFVSNQTIDSYGRQDLDTVGTGKGYYITKGYALPINWTKSSRNDKTKYTYSDGKEITVNDGNTFIQIIPSTSNITLE